MMVLAVGLIVPVVPAGAIAYAVSGRVTLEGVGTPLAGVTVTLWDDSLDEPVADTTTDAAGDYHFATLANADYTLEFILEGHSSRYESFTYSGTPVTRNVQLSELDQIAAGTVTAAADSSPVEDAMVEAYKLLSGDAGYSWIGWAFTDAAGDYALYDEEGGGAGDYVFVANADGFEEAEQDKSWNGTDVLDVDFALEAKTFGSVKVEGEDRFETAVAASQLVFPEDGMSESVIIASGRNFPDALGGSALAGALYCPVLLTEPGSLPTVVADEVKRLGATNVVIVGGIAAVSETVAKALDDLPGVTVDRIAGEDRYETAQLIAERTVDELGPGYLGDVIFATGINFPDALAAAPLATWGGTPILLVKRDEIPDATLDAIAAIEPDYGIVVGGEKVVGPDVYEDLETGFGADGIERIFGANRYETAAEIAQYGYDVYGLAWDGVAFATGLNFPDALAGGAAQGLTGSPVLLTMPNSLEPAPEEKLIDYAAEIFEVRYFGGLKVLDAATRTKIENTVLANK